MKLRTYLMKRTIHMIITILIVLVLLFVLYRMMPGSAAASMMMNPKMTQNEINMVMVRYGFGSWTDYPGDYLVANVDPETIGTYTIRVEAVDGDGQSDSFSTSFDVNPLPDMDLISPKVLDAGIVSANIGQKGEFFARVYDIGAIKDVEVTLVYPTHELQDGLLVRFSEVFPLTPIENMSDDTNDTYYFSGKSTENLVMGEDGSSDYTVIFKAQDRSRNYGTSAISFNAVSGQVHQKIYGLSANILYVNNGYAYPSVNAAMSLTAIAEGTAPAFQIIAPDSASQSISSVFTPDALGNYNGTFTPLENGQMTFMVSAGGINATYSFPVNALGTMPAVVQDDDTSSPVLSDLAVNVIDRQGRTVVSPDYPFTIRDLRLKINATALDSDGKRCSEVIAYITKPDGSVSEVYLLHPTYVKMRTMAEQFVTYMKTMLVFDFGTSYMYQRPAWDVILERVPSTALLFGTSLVVSYILGISIGVVVAWRRGTVLEMGTIIVTLFFYSMPIFWFALIMQWVFYAQLGWFPLAGMGGIDSSGNPIEGFAWFVDVLWHLTMPLITLVILGLAGTILLMRSAMLEVIGEDFTTTAKAKGLKERTVVYRHVARNAMLPVVTSMAMSVGSIISGGVLTETIFSWYGMGTLLIEGTLSKDFPVVQGAFYILALLTIFGNMAADILYAWLDPRVQL
jgi:peptide/nickel transport system permease protein